jgi:cobalt-zinc-cadmium resistance protein CzcA
MINLLVKALDKNFLVLFCFGLVIIAGLYSFSRLAIDAFPDLTNNQVQILVDAPGMSPYEVEELITVPTEAFMSSLPKIQELRSISKFGLSVITVVFKDSVDTYFARQLVSEKLQQAKTKLPQGIEADLGPISTGMGEIFQYVVTGHGYTTQELKTIQDWDIKYQLRSVPGVNEVNTWGGFTAEYHVVIDPIKLQQYNLSLKDIMSALENNNQNFSGGIVERNSEQYLIRGIGKIQNISDIENILIKNSGNFPVSIKNIAKIEIGSQIRQGAATQDGKGEVVTGIVMMLKGENSRDVIKRVKEKIKEINKSLPESVIIKPFYDQTLLIEQTIKTVRTNLIEGSMLVIAVLLFLLGNIRAALIAACAIPISLMFSFIGMKSLGITANIMSLGAIDFGMIVDGAIVMVENILHRKSHSKSDLEFNEVVAESLKEMAKPIGFGILIITIVYIPILSLEGIEYKMFSPMVFTVCFALLGSLITALLLVPTLCLFFLKNNYHEKENKLLEKIKKLYISKLTIALQQPKKIINCAILSFIASCILLGFLGTEFVPKLDEGDMIIEIRNLTSISVSGAIKASTNAELALLEIPEIKTIVTKTGRPDLGTDPMGVYASDMFVHLKPHDQWRFGMNKTKLIAEMKNKLNQKTIGSKYNFTQPIAMRVDELVSGVRSDVAIKIFGDDLDTLVKKAEEIEKIISGISGQTDLQVEKLVGSKQLIIKPDRNLMKIYGVDITDIRIATNTALMGTEISEIIDGQVRFSLKIKFSDSTLENLRKLLIDTNSGMKIPLTQVAQLEILDGVEVINREYGQRRIIVQMNVEGRDMGSFVKDAKKEIAKKIKLDPGYHIEWGGQFKNQERAMKKLLIVVPIAILIIFGLLFLSFGSLQEAFIVLLNVPLALIGGVLALWIRGMYISVPAVIGFIALFGVAVLNGLVLISTFKKLKKEISNLDDLILQGAESRLRPVLMTALVAILGFLPMAISHSTGAEVQKPLATVVIGGLLSSTLLTLFVLPCVFKNINKNKIK